MSGSAHIVHSKRRKKEAFTDEDTDSGSLAAEETGWFLGPVLTFPVWVFSGTDRRVFIFSSGKWRFTCLVRLLKKLEVLYLKCLAQPGMSLMLSKELLQLPKIDSLAHPWWNWDPKRDMTSTSSYKHKQQNWDYDPGLPFPLFQGSLPQYQILTLPFGFLHDVRWLTHPLQVCILISKIG